MPVPAVHLWALREATVYLCQDQREREETPVPQEMGSQAKMVNQAYQVFRGLLVLKAAWENLELLELAFQDHKAWRDQGGFRVSLDLSDPQDYLAPLALQGKRGPEEMLGFQDCRGRWALEQQGPRVKTEPLALKDCPELTEDLDVMELRGTRANLESATASCPYTRAWADLELQELQ